MGVLPPKNLLFHALPVCSGPFKIHFRIEGLEETKEDRGLDSRWDPEEGCSASLARRERAIWTRAAVPSPNCGPCRAQQMARAAGVPGDASGALDAVAARSDAELQGLPGPFMKTNSLGAPLLVLGNRCPRSNLPLLGTGKSTQNQGRQTY